MRSSMIWQLEHHLPTASLAQRRISKETGDQIQYYLHTYTYRRILEQLMPKWTMLKSYMQRILAHTVRGPNGIMMINVKVVAHTKQARTMINILK